MFLTVLRTTKILDYYAKQSYFPTFCIDQCFPVHLCIIVCIEIVLLCTETLMTSKNILKIGKILSYLKKQFFDSY